MVSSISCLVGDKLIRYTTPIGYMHTQANQSFSAFLLNCNKQSFSTQVSNATLENGEHQE
jgi:hypothetical protein